MSAFLIDSRFLLSNTTETFWGAPLIVADGKDNTFCYGFLRDLLRLRNSLCISAGVIVSRAWLLLIDSDASPCRHAESTTGVHK
jgi:hypothetical protein